MKYVILVVVLGFMFSILSVILLGSQAMFLMGLMIMLSVSVFSASYIKGIELGGFLNVDFISFLLGLLSLYIVLLSFFSSTTVERKFSFGCVIFIVLALLFLSFFSSSAIFFYVFFESVLLPTFVLIMGWGYQPERIQAVMYMVIYTVVGSMPLLYGMMKLFFEGKSLFMCSVSLWSFKFDEIFPWFFFLAFMVKLPMFPFHIWLPKAHVEAPVAGSMLLAGLLLKLGGYGMYRFSGIIEFNMWNWGVVILLFIALWGGVLSSVVCMRQIDLKCLVAYSSVGHMSFVMLGCLSNVGYGYLGALIIMVGHGLCSSGLFAMVNMMYLNSGSRLISLNKGYLSMMPSLSLMCFLLSSSNMACPPSLNLMGEIMVYVAGAFMSWLMIVLLGVISFMSACYSLFIYVGTQHGKSGEVYELHEKFYFLDFLNLFFHWFPLNFLFLLIFLQMLYMYLID
uniref:NADH dehydrogenase subunit 4 n=1 Tax=Vignadula atrata TaxID=1289577 RepID=UPI001FA7884B|nr:NADH dehydrogenase subunit 4 [Vignadula atrata]ULT46703.1 NADH dehydrogenase subunit 4 [Vignadula atrata]